jgi:hypothetical protein
MHDAAVVFVIVWLGGIAGVVLLASLVASRPDLRFHQWRVRRHNRRRGGVC